jgi:hypothetical protein
VTTDWRTIDRINVLERRLEQARREIPSAERAALAAAQTRADSVAARFGGSVSSPIPGEGELDYRKRLAEQFQPHSPRFSHSRLSPLDAATFGMIEAEVYADAVRAADASVQPGTLKAIEERDRSGRLVTRYVGDVGAFLAPFVSGGYTGNINEKL